MEFDALAQIELNRHIVDEAPCGREVSLVGTGIVVAVNERVPDMVGNDAADDKLIVVGVYIVQRRLIGEVKRIVGLPRERGGRENASGEQRDGNCTNMAAA